MPCLFKVCVGGGEAAVCVYVCAKLVATKLDPSLHTYLCAITHILCIFTH